MKAEIIAPQGFRIAPEGHTVVLFQKGAIVSGWVAESAIQTGYAKRIDEIAESLERKATPVMPEPPAKRPRGRPRKVQQ
jgi:hypothetical protein